jgi:hypothetical protein
VDRPAEVGAELETRAEAVSGEIAIMGPAMRSMAEWLAEKATYTEEDEWASMERIISEVLQSETPDEVLRQKLPVHARDILNRPMALNGFRVIEGDYEDAVIPFYLALEVTYGNPPEPHVVTCGGLTMLAQIKVLDDIGDWPQVIEIRQKDKPTKKGYHPLRLHRPDTGIR